MINLVIALALAAAAFGGFAAWLGWTVAIFPAAVAGAAAFVLLARRSSKQLEAAMPEVQKAIMARRFDDAIRKLEALRPLARWQFLVGSALDAQIGMILYAYKQKPDEARPHLERAFVKQWQAKAMLAAHQYRKKDFEAMAATFEQAIKANKKVGFLYNAFAWCEWKRGEKDKALDILARGLKVLPDDERLKSNQVNLQNGRKIKMKPYAEEWWALLLERPPVQMVAPGGRPPKQRRARRR